MNKILRAVLGVSFFTVISRVLGFVRDIAIAYKLGSGPLADVFFIALKIPNFFRRIFAEGAFSLSFIPLYSEILVSKNEKEAQKFANHVFYFFVIALLVLVLLFEIFMPQIMFVFAPGYRDDDMLIFLARITFPYIFFISVATFLNAILNNFKVFIPGSLLPIMFNVGIISALFLLYPLTANHAVSMAFGVTGIGVVQLCFMYFYTRKKGKLIKLKRDKSEKNLGKFWHKFLPALFAAGIIQLNSWIDVMIGSLFPNAVSYIYYSDRLVQLPLAITGISLSVVMLPTLAQKIKEKKKGEVNELFSKAVLLGLFFGMPALFGLFYLAQEIVISFFGRGAFGEKAISETAVMLMIFSLAVPAYILLKILLTLFYAGGDTKTPVKTGFVTLLVNLVLNLVLIRFYSFYGIAIATVISSWLNVLMLSLVIWKKKMVRLDFADFKRFIIVVLNSVVLFACLFFMQPLLDGFMEKGLFSQIVTLGFVIFVAVVFYLLISFRLIGYVKR